MHLAFLGAVEELARTLSCPEAKNLLVKEAKSKKNTKLRLRYAMVVFRFQSL